MGLPKGGDFRTAALPSWLERRDGRSLLALHVQPGARRTAVVGVHGRRLKVAVATAPVDGRANAALLAFIAARLGVARASVELVSGAHGREKRVAVHAELTEGQVAALAALPAQK